MYKSERDFFVCRNRNFIIASFVGVRGRRFGGNHNIWNRYFCLIENNALNSCYLRGAKKPCEQKKGDDCMFVYQKMLPLLFLAFVKARFKDSRISNIIVDDDL